MEFSKPVFNRKKTGFLSFQSSRFLDGFERLSADGYFSHDSSHSENVATARRVFVTSITTDKTQQCILQNAEEDYVVQNSASI